MPYIFTCDCGQQMTVTDAQIGKMGKCVNCGQNMKIVRDKLTLYEMTQAPEQPSNPFQFDPSQYAASHASSARRGRPFFSQKRELTEQQKGCLGCLVLLVAAFMLLYVIGDISKDDSGTGQRSRRRTPEHMLAIINAGGYVSENDPTVARFRMLLNSLKGKCKNTPMEISDAAVVAQTQLKKEGINENLLVIMTALDRSIPDDMPKDVLDIKEIAAGYVVLRTSGYFE